MENEPSITWDEAKRAATLRERGIDFADMAAFDWDSALTAEDDRLNYPEVRYVSIGRLDNTLVVCVWCYRNHATRIISLRKANARERERYEQTID
ncbi:MAG: BrnT family toxin [Rhodospirillaceae bacterium]|nr:BrnT family toxin [Rhodospirillaceae bacterium]